MSVSEVLYNMKIKDKPSAQLCNHTSALKVPLHDFSFALPVRVSVPDCHARTTSG